MKFVIFALALIGAASAGYISPFGYAGYSGFGWGHGIATPAVAAYSAPAFAAYSAPAVAAYTAPVVAPIVKSVVAAPAFSAYSAPVVTPAFSTYTAGYGGYATPALYGHGYGYGWNGVAAAPAFGYDLWKKKAH